MSQGRPDGNHPWKRRNTSDALTAKQDKRAEGPLATSTKSDERTRSANGSTPVPPKFFHPPVNLLANRPVRIIPPEEASE